MIGIGILILNIQLIMFCVRVSEGLLPTTASGSILQLCQRRIEGARGTNSSVRLGWAAKIKKASERPARKGKLMILSLQLDYSSWFFSAEAL